MSDAEMAALREEMAEQRAALRQDLAEDLGGDPEDYDASAILNRPGDEPVTDGGE